MVFSGLLLLFVVLPLVELMVLLKLHALVGFFDTLAIVVLTGVLGASLARAQGLMVLGQIQRELAEGRMPAPRLFDGVMILIAGALLITPGLITDTVGFLLLVPFVRAAIRRWSIARIERHFEQGGGSVTIWRL